LPLESTDAHVILTLEPRQKGLLWYSTYKVDFQGLYQFHNPSTNDENVTFYFQFPSEKALYDGFYLKADGAALPVSNSGGSASAEALVGAGKTVSLQVGYRSQGIDSWRYSFGKNAITQVRKFKLVMDTNFRDVDFPDDTLSPSSKQATAGGWELTWDYSNLLSGFQVALDMPQKLQPGPLAARICFFAPVSLFFFFFLMFIITTLREIELHPMNYFFLAAAFFSFHLLLAYLADHIDLNLAFLICSAVSIFLVVTYLRLVTGARFALLEAAGTQLIYLVLFSYAFFFKGFTGLTVTIGSILTLFVVMQMTGRIRWAEKFTPARAASTA